MELRGISLFLTYKCNARCMHCGFNSSPKKKGVMEPRDAESYFKELKDHPLKWVYIGEEAFLYYDRLLEIVRLAKSVLDVPVLLGTNGFWGRSKEVAREKLMKLKDAGLTHFEVYVDGFRQKYVPIEFVRNALDAAKELGFESVSAHVTFLESEDASNEFDVATRGILKKRDVSDIETHTGRPQMIGRAAETLAQYLPRRGIPQKKCEPPYWVGKDLKNPTGIVIEPFGWITFCPGISIGNAKEKNLSKIVEEYDHSAHPIIKVLADEGPKGLLELAKRRGFISEEGYVDECHLCYELRKYLRTHYPEYLAPKSYYEN